MAKWFKDFGKLITVYQDPKNKTSFAKINWCAIGAVSSRKAGVFRNQLNKAILFADKLKQKSEVK